MVRFQLTVDGSNIEKKHAMETPLKSPLITMQILQSVKSNWKSDIPMFQKCSIQLTQRQNVAVYVDIEMVLIHCPLGDVAGISYMNISNKT